MFYLDFLSDSLKSHFKSRFIPSKDNEYEYLYYKNSKSAGVSCTEEQYDNYITILDRALAHCRKILTTTIFVSIPIVLSFFILADKYALDIIYVKAATIIYFLIPIVYSVKKYIDANSEPNTLYSEAKELHRKRSFSEVRESRIREIPYGYLFASNIFCVCAFHLYFFDESHESMGGWTLMLYISAFIIINYLSFYRETFAIRFGLQTGKRTTFGEGKPSTPTEAKLKPMVWLKHNPYAVLIGIGLIVSFILSIRYIYLIPIFAILLYLNRHHWVHHIEKLAGSDACQAIVISENPCLIAVHTDLARLGFKEYEAIKILKYKPKKITRQGERVATAASYKNPKDENSPHWLDFHPTPVSYATDEEAELQKTLNLFSNKDWQELQHGLQQIEQPYKPGLYKIQTANTGWQA